MPADLGYLEYVVRTIAQTAVDNEKEFGDLDAVVGDGDFGYSLARGFEIVLAEWDTLDRGDPGVFLQKIALIISKRVGGTSGPSRARRTSPARTRWPRCAPPRRASGSAATPTWATRRCSTRWSR
jgi:Dak2 domain-containing protein